MKFVLEKNKDAGHRVTINIPKIIIDKALTQEFYKINQKTNINGFRKGKIPIKIIQQKYGNNIYYDVFNKLMQKFFFEFLNKEKINIIGYPKYYLEKKEENNENFNYSVIYEVYPDIQIQTKKLHFITVEQSIVKITDEDIKKNILGNQTNKTVWNQVNRSIKIYDRVKISYLVYENNKKLETFDIKNIQFVVSKNNLLNELNNQIINRYVNDVIFLKLPFSLFHPEEKFCNKNIVLKIKIIEIEEQEELKTEKNAQHIKFIESNLNSIKNQIIQNINKFTENHLKNQIINKLTKLNPIKIPPILLKEEIKNLHNKLVEEYKTKKNILDKRYHVNLESKAKKRLCTKLILEKIISDNKILINEEKIKEAIKEISKKYKKPLEIIHIYNKNKVLRETIKDLLLEKEAMIFLKNRINILNKYYTFNEFINCNINYSEELFF